MKNKTIFTIMTLGLVTLLGFGFLGGINYQPKEAKASEITTQPNKKYRLFNNESEFYYNDKLFYIVAKNYAQNGKGVFYTNNPYLSESAIIGSELGTRSFADFTLIKPNASEVTTMQFITASVQGIYRLDVVSLYKGDNIQVIYNADSSWGDFKRENCAFIARNFIPSGSTEQRHAFYFRLTTFFDIYVIEDTAFDFIDNFNYNAWAGPDGATRVPGNLTSVRNYEAIIGNQGNDFPGSNVVTYNVPKFYAGNLVFDKIQVYYISATGLSFEWNNDIIISRLTPPNHANEYVYYSHMFFINSATQYTIEVNRRDGVYTTGTHGTIIRQSTTWLDNAFKHIQFFEGLTDNDVRFFDATRNNLDVGTGFYDNVGADIGLGNAFSLIGQAFTAWLPILQVTIVPGITLGLLLFLPLIAGIVIFIIWIVKR